MESSESAEDFELNGFEIACKWHLNGMSYMSSGGQAIHQLCRGEAVRLSPSSERPRTKLKHEPEACRAGPWHRCRCDSPSPAPGGARLLLFSPLFSSFLIFAMSSSSSSASCCSFVLWMEWSAVGKRCTLRLGSTDCMSCRPPEGSQLHTLPAPATQTCTGKLARPEICSPAMR